MPKLEVTFEWDEERLGKGWFNIDALELILYSSEHTKRDLLKVSQITQDTEQGDRDEIDAPFQGLLIYWLVHRPMSVQIKPNLYVVLDD